MSAGTKITRKGEVLIAALLSEPTHAAAATKSGLSEATVQRWLNDPAFVVAYRAARRSVLEGAIGSLQRASTKAVETLERNLACGSPGAEIRAAIAILDSAIKGVEQLELAARIDELEMKAKARRPK